MSVPRWSDVVVAGVVGLFLGMAVWAPDESTPTVPVTPVTRVTVVTVPVTPVYVPAGVEVCPAEDSCRLDYTGGRWVIIPGGDR